MNLEYESESALVLTDVRVIVPCPAAATVAEVGEGDARSPRPPQPINIILGKPFLLFKFTSRDFFFSPALPVHKP